MHQRGVVRLFYGSLTETAKQKRIRRGRKQNQKAFRVLNYMKPQRQAVTQNTVPAEPENNEKDGRRNPYLSVSAVNKRTRVSSEKE